MCVSYAVSHLVVNPQAVNEPDFDVFTANVRSILYLTHTRTRRQVAFVAIGALLVGSISWTAEKDKTVKRGEELGSVQCMWIWRGLMFSPQLFRLRRQYCRCRLPEGYDRVSAVHSFVVWKD
jgi:hypothetical protein